jgi:asparagine synthase (glutamine-hydrolysing)
MFASEIKALLSSGSVPFELNPHAIDLYFHYGYVPEPLTPLKGVRKLPAGHLLIVKTDPWSIRQKCYWRMDQASPVEADPVSTIRSELDAISKIIIRSDVPVGVALSGGIDSSAVLALGARHYPGTLHAFSVGYEGTPPSDERKDARMLADYLKVPFHDIELKTQDIACTFPELIYWRDDPIADISGSGYFSVMKRAKEENVPVILLGQGGDELFWGYPWIQRAAKESMQKEALLNRKWFDVVKNYVELHLPQVWTPWGIRSWLFSLGGLRQGWERFQRHMDAPEDQLIFYDLTPDYRMAIKGTPDIYSAGFREQLQGKSPSEIFTIEQPWNFIDILITRLISQTYLLENGIAQSDRLSMAASVEARIPLVDFRLYETVIGLRMAQSDLHLPPKKWLKDAISDVVPSWVLERRKRGFEPPVLEWHKAIFERHGHQLNDSYLASAGVLKPESTRMLASGEFPKGAIVPLSFKALVLELWCRRFSTIT